MLNKLMILAAGFVALGIVANVLADFADFLSLIPQ
jgi:hypothetical protein